MWYSNQMNSGKVTYILTTCHPAIRTHNTFKQTWHIIAKRPGSQSRNWKGHDDKTYTYFQPGGKETASERDPQHEKRLKCKKNQAMTECGKEL